MSNPTRTSAAALLLATALAGNFAGCDLDPPTPDSGPPATKKAAVKGLTESVKDSKPASQKPLALQPEGPAMPTAFVRERPQLGPKGGVGACAYLGFVGMACLSALLEEKDPVKRQYMRRLSDAGARLALDDLQKGQPAGVAHAEVALYCAESGACKQTNADGAELDDGYSCLTKAEAALQEGDAAAANKAHARACKCDPKRAQIPVMGGVLACDGADKPVKRGESLSLEEAKEIRACGECDHDTGPAACRREVARLGSTEPALAKYLREVHAPRCAKP